MSDIKNETYELINKKVNKIKDKKNIQVLVNLVDDMVEEESKINLSARVNTIELRCRNCGSNCTNFVLKEYSPYLQNMENDKKRLDKTVGHIPYTFVSEANKCPECGSNTFEADIGIAVDITKSNNT